MVQHTRKLSGIALNANPWSVAIRLGLMLSVMCAAGGCATSLTATTSEAQCAGRKPIHYNSRNPKSEYYAAPKLAPQIAEANVTGENLKCPAFMDDAPPPR